MNKIKAGFGALLGEAIPVAFHVDAQISDHDRNKPHRVR
jgi:hypothetical protein